MVKNKDIWNKVVNEVVESNLPGKNVAPVGEVVVDSNLPVVMVVEEVVEVLVVMVEEGRGVEATVLVVVVVEVKWVGTDCHKQCTFHKRFDLWKLM